MEAVKAVDTLEEADTNLEVAADSLQEEDIKVAEVEATIVYQRIDNTVKLSVNKLQTTRYLLTYNRVIIS